MPAGPKKRQRKPVKSIICNSKRNQGSQSTNLAAILLPWYIGTNLSRIDFMTSPRKQLEIQRVQTGVRMERRILKVLKALAEYKNMTLGDLLEGIVLHAFDGKVPFSAETLRKVAELKAIYELDLDAHASHRLKEKS
jgi:hypothetical protein